MSANADSSDEHGDELRRRLAAAEQELARCQRELSTARIWRRVVEELPIGINVYRLEVPGDAGKLRMIGINRAADEAVGTSMEAFVGQTLEESMPGALETDAPHACVRAVQTGSAQSIPDLVYDDPDIPGAGRTYTVRAIPLSADHVVVLFENVSEVRRLAAEREQRMSELTEANQRLARLDDLKRRFFANVSHELRTPLTLIEGPVHRLLGDPNLAPEHRPDLELIARNARYLLRQVEDLLDAARLDVQGLHLQYVQTDLAMLIRTVCRDFEPVAAERRVALTVQAQESVAAQVDAQRLGQVLLNLLSNALKFARTSVRVSLTWDDDSATLEVSDDGPGVPPKRREAVFGRFVQLDETMGGAGLGLTIARDLVELHGGTIAMDAAPEGGALLRVVLPRAAPPGTVVSADVTRRAVPQPTPAVPAPAPGPAPAPAPAEVDAEEAATSVTSDNDRPVVVVVEDNPDMARFIASVLSPYQVHIASDGREGLELTQRVDPDLVVTDLMMPVMSGEELIDALRADERSMHIPVIALTARSGDDVPVAVLSRGADDYLAKPFRPEELLVRSRNAITVKRTRDVLQRELSSTAADVESLARAVAAKTADLDRALASLSVALQSAEEASEAKSTFLRLMSHEFNTPLQSLRFAVERLQRNNGSDAPSPSAVGSIARATHRLVGMVDGLLQYVRLERGAIEVARREISVLGVVQTVLDDFAEAAAAKGLALVSGSEGREVRAVTDPELLRMIVGNLVGNAVKYTEAGSVDVVVSRDEAGVRIDVSDTGCGIPPEAHELIFEPFEHLEPIGSKHIAGVGLGLALVREMVHKLGGEVSVRSRADAGSIFTVTLPEAPT